MDVETTGLYSSDRVVELACVVLDLDGQVVVEWDTLINPCRDVGPSWIHGVTPAMVADAPTFDEVALVVGSILNGATLAAHNLPFDQRMLAGEMARVGLVCDWGAGVDTLRLARARLTDACASFGIDHRNPHGALSDALAAAALLCAVADRAAQPAIAARFDCPTTTGCRRLRRDATGHVVVDHTPYLASLVDKMHHSHSSPEMLGYLDLVGRALADDHLTYDEVEELAEFANLYALSDDDRRVAHLRFVDELIDAATADDLVTAEEYDELCRAAASLGVGQDRVDRRTLRQRLATADISVERGMTVCFTGAPADSYGGVVPRANLEAHARGLGLEPVPSVTKKTRLLVAADPESLSGKAGKARRYGIPIVSADAFLDASSITALPGVVVAVNERQTLTCTRCNRTWTREPRRAAATPRSGHAAQRPRRSAMTALAAMYDDPSR